MQTESKPTASQARPGQTSPETPSPVMEVVRVRAAKGTTDQQLADAARATDALVRAQPGFLARHLLRDETGGWTDLVLWSGRAEAQAASARVTADPAFGPYMAAIDVSSVSMAHEAVIWSMTD